MRSYKKLDKRETVKIIGYIIVSTLFGILLIVGLNYFYGFGSLAFYLVLGILIVLSDVAIAFSMERSAKEHPEYLKNTLEGESGAVVKSFNQCGAIFEGIVTVNGENWTASSTEPLNTGDNILVRARHGLKLEVERYA